MCSRIINDENLPQSVKIHFEIVHGQSRMTYHINTNHGQREFTIAPARITGKCREGARPSSGKSLLEYDKELDRVMET